MSGVRPPPGGVSPPVGGVRPPLWAASPGSDPRMSQIAMTSAAKKIRRADTPRFCEVFHNSVKFSRFSRSFGFDRPRDEAADVGDREADALQVGFERHARNRPRVARREEAGAL